MVTRIVSYTKEDTVFFNLCKAVAGLSTCKDKQVGAVLTHDRGISMGYNSVIGCNGLCDKTCEVMHAEIMALRHAPEWLRNPTMYINLFPCLACQEAMAMAGVRKIVVFGEQGNKETSARWRNSSEYSIQIVPDLSIHLLRFNGEKNALGVVQGELAELITAISNYNNRSDRAESKEELLEDIWGEVNDVRLQLDILTRALPYRDGKAPEFRKLNKLLRKFETIFFPDKDIPELFSDVATEK